LEAEIDRLADAVERNRKLMVGAKATAVVGMLVLLALAVGLPWAGPVGFVLAVAAVLGGLTLSGSGRTTHHQLLADIRARETERAEIISALDIREAGEGR